MNKVFILALITDILYLLSLLHDFYKIGKLNKGLKKFPEFIDIIYRDKAKFIFGILIILCTTIVLKNFSYVYIGIGIAVFLIILFIEKVLKITTNVDRLFIYEISECMIIWLYYLLITFEIYIRGV